MRDQRIDAKGTRRRLQAMSCLGWSMREFGLMAGLHYRPIMKLRNGEQTKINVSTGLKIAKAYEQHCMEVKHGQYADLARDQAIAKGWVPPLGWDNIDTDRVKHGFIDKSKTPSIR